MKEATELFTKVFINLPTRWSEIYGFRQVAKLGLPHAAKILAVDRREAVERMISDPANRAIFLDKTKFLEASGGPEAIGAAITEQQLTTFQDSVDSASLVFMHSALDAAAFDLCRVAALAAPGDWAPFVSAHKVTLSDVRESGYGVLFNRRLGDHLSALERESILSKTDRLFQLCRPTPDFVPANGYQFDRERIEKLDRARHSVIHGDGAKASPDDVEASIEFLLNTGMFLVALVNHRYGVRVDPARLIQQDP